MPDRAGVETIAGFPVNVVRSGVGPESALFIHCSLAHSGAWAAVQDRFRDRLTMTSFDRPGHGRSGSWDRGPDGSAVHDLTTAIASDLFDAPGHVLGHSFGATVALRLALEQPGQVKTLVLFEPVLFAAIADQPIYAAVEGLMSELDTMIDTGNTRGAASLFNDATNPELPFANQSARRQEKLAQQIHLIRDESPATMQDLTGILRPGGLEGLDCPVLILESGNPPRGVRAVHDVLLSRLPEARREIIDGAGHMAPITHPEKVADAIAEFLGR